MGKSGWPWADSTQEVRAGSCVGSTVVGLRSRGAAPDVTAALVRPRWAGRAPLTIRSPSRRRARRPPCHAQRRHEPRHERAALRAFRRGVRRAGFRQRLGDGRDAARAASTRRPSPAPGPTRRASRTAAPGPAPSPAGGRGPPTRARPAARRGRSAPRVVKRWAMTAGARRALERRAPDQHLVADDGERVLVGARVHRPLAGGLLGRHVGRRAERQAGLGQPVLVGSPSARAMPKSATSVSPSSVSRMFSGLMSRWMTPSRWA